MLVFAEAVQSCDSSAWPEAVVALGFMLMIAVIVVVAIRDL